MNDVLGGASSFGTKALVGSSTMGQADFLRFPSSRPMGRTDIPQQRTNARVVFPLRDLLPITRELKAVTTRLEQLERAAPIRMTEIRALGHPNFRLRMALPVELHSPEGEAATAHAPDLGVYGEADTEYEALASLRTEIADHFQFLLENESRLAPGLTGELHRYRELIEIAK